MKRRSWIRGLGLVSSSIVAAHHPALAQQTAGSASSATGPANPSPTPASSSGDLDEIVVNGIKRGELILPTTVTSTSAYGLDLGVMDTPRNNTLLSKAQLDALNIQNPGGFSYLTSSSYSDASFGQPNIPRIRGQYADLFFNGMRDSFTLNGYGAPISFNSVDSVDIIKGPASVQAGPGAGVGGSIDITTKMPTFTKLQGSFDLEADSQQKRRASFDIGGPLTSNVAARVSFTSDDSGSYYHDMYFHQQSLFASVLAELTPRYSVLITGGFEDTRYRENDGVNRVNQNLIDNGAYLTGAPDPSTISGFGTAVFLGPSVQLGDRIIIDEPPGTGAHSLHAKAQIIQTFKATDDFSIVNNTFYDYLNRYNQTEDYYADTAKGSFTIENKTDFKLKFTTGSVSHDLDAGFTYRYAHVLDIQNFLNEPVSVFDLSGNPNNWVVPANLQIPSGTFAYNAAFNHQQYGLPGRFQGYPGAGGFFVGGFLNGTVDSNLQDAAVFLEHRIQFSSQWSVLYGLRFDGVQLNYSDPLGGADYGVPPGSGLTPLPQSASTAWYGLYNGNVSLVYSPTEHVSAYLTWNKGQYVLPTANDGAVAVWGEDPTNQLRQNTLLEEAGVKLDLFEKRLFISTAGFRQQRTITTGPGGLADTLAHITGAEFELNFQPNPHFFATASYSYLHTTLDSPSPFYNFPAQPGLNYDGAGISLFPAAEMFLPNQKFQDPGVPHHLFNVLANYKHESGWGAQANVQVTGPIEVTQSGYLNLAAITNPANFPYPGLAPSQLAAFEANGGYYKSPQIPWQYTVNTAAFYSFDKYMLKFSIYNLTDRHNLINDVPFYGNDFITRVPPRSYDLAVSGKF